MLVTGIDRGAKAKILVVDDLAMNRELLTEILGDTYEIHQAENGRQAVNILVKESHSFACMLLDIIMPEMNGYEVLEWVKENQILNYLPVVVISSDDRNESIAKAFALGAREYISRPFDFTIVRRRVENMIELFGRQRNLASLVVDGMMQNRNTKDVMFDTLSAMVEFRNNESGQHVQNIRRITGLLLKELVKRTDKYALDDKTIDLIVTASSMHDIGKISIPDRILNKPGKLTDEEFEIMKTHTTTGARMLENGGHMDSTLIQMAYKICRWHHERWDGNGYPDGLKGDEIPISAQAVSLADVYDALTAERVYKPPFSPEKSLSMITNNECGVFNPLLIDALLAVKDELANQPAPNRFLASQTERELQKMVWQLMNNNS